MAFQEIEDLGQIANWNAVLRMTLLGMSVSNEQRVLNSKAEPNPDTVYRFNSVLWWLYRQHRRHPGARLQYNNLFGYGEPKSHSEIEVNFPMEKYRRTLQGALVYDTDTPNSILLAHRGRVEHGGQYYVHDENKIEVQR
jgi:hypothetical protein